MKKIYALCLMLYALSNFPSAAFAAEGKFDFDRWNTILNKIQERAVAERVDDKVINATIQDAAFIPKVVWRDQNQPHFKMSMQEYVESRVSAVRIASGRKKAKEYPTLLRRTGQKYGVPAEVILAFWGMESSYGEFKGKHKISDSFLTLIYEGRREKFFMDNLISLMKIASKNKLEISEIRGAYDGGMGHFQFMPATLAQYGADGNGDGRIDIINNISDAMFSAGNYLSKMGWNANEKIVRQVELPEKFDMSLCDGKTKKTLGEWRAMGVSGVPNADMAAGLICDMQDGGAGLSQTGEPDDLGTRPPHLAYLAYPNFYRIKRWNNSNWYAVAVALLSEELK